ncbi:AraC-like DNA-binding protein [Orenia metallireducens]|jgi:YesN/AraC family two-component response regulator|uniref:AraC-type DNA-binding protein n=1 Tax=Orenia metallireducens TaxID=1413210 RepID=A0A285GAI3_9FIRM|nr:AraC family transcriptional regulator [Orenia metallireducens]PRX28280.1 AraC-like DNA-binding protein [Orenia metallireducens]SNY19536.1 AraC-type DNA-binding protein [Orenia metallireducens]
MASYLINHIKRTGGPHTMSAKHYHNSYELYYLLNGERYYFIKDQRYHIKKGNIVIINKNILHKTIDTDNPNHERILIEFNEKLLESLDQNITDINLYKCFNNDNTVLSLDIEEQLWLEEKLFKVLKEKKHKQKGYNTYIKILITEILIFLNRISLKYKKEATYSDPINTRILNIVTYINKHYNDNLTLEKISNKYHLSSSYLCKTFKEVTGFNFVEYKNHIRVKEAQRLLQQTNLNITDIASKVGYNNLTHFGRVFKSITGYSPMKYRNLN